MEESSSERRDESEESRSGGARDRPGRGGRRAARPMTPPHHPPPPSTSPRRSPRLSQSSAARDLRNLPTLDRSVEMSTGGGRAGHRQGRSGQGRWSRSREPTPPQLMNFSKYDFTVVSHTTDSLTFTSAHPFFPGWVRVVRAHCNDRVWGTPCAHNPEEELRAKRRVRRDVEPPEVRRFLRQELLRKVGHSWWNRPRVYRHDLADERESTPSVRSVVVIPSDPEQPEVSLEQQGPGPSGSGDRMTLVGPVASPITSLPCTPCRDILLPGDAEESPRTREGQVAAATLEQEMGRRSVAAAIPIKDRAVPSSSSATEPITQEMVAEACDTLVRERHPASPPVWPEGSQPPTQSDPDRPRGIEILQEPPLPRRKTASTPRPEGGGSLRGAERGPASAMFSQSPVVRQEKQPSLRTHVPETEESESDISSAP